MLRLRTRSVWVGRELERGRILPRVSRARRGLFPHLALALLMLLLGARALGSVPGSVTAATPTATAGAAAPGPGGGVLPRVGFIGALKLPLAGIDYDDDPGSSARFHVGPAPQLAVTQAVRASILIATEGAEPVAEVHTAVRASSESGPLTFHLASRGTDLVSGAGCQAALTPSGAAGALLAGFVATGQMNAVSAARVLDDCRNGKLALLNVTFQVPRELRPGTYFICASSLTAAGRGLAPVCTPFEVVPVGAYAADIGTDGLSLEPLSQGVESAASGDSNFGSGGSTIANTGNTAPPIAVWVWPFALEVPPTAAAVHVKGAYRVTITSPARPGASAVVESESMELLDGEPATRDFASVCLYPGESARFDFAVTPQPGPLPSGDYSGALGVAAGDGQSCLPASAELVPPFLRVVPTSGPFAAGWAAASWTWYRDADGDGYGDKGASVVSDLGPTPPAGHVASSDDCDDSKSGVHPGAVEVADGLDNDCDGVVDPPALAATPTATASPTATAAPTASPAATAAPTPTAPPVPPAPPLPTATPTKPYTLDSLAGAERVQAQQLIDRWPFLHGIGNHPGVPIAALDGSVNLYSVAAKALGWEVVIVGGRATAWPAGEGQVAHPGAIVWRPGDLYKP